MGLHHKHTHGRVFRGLEAREQLEIQKRDSHGNNIKLHVPEGFEEKANVQTAVSVVYVTLPQTFSGSAVYVTMSGNPNAATSVASQAAAATSSAATSSADAEASSNAVESSAQVGNHASSTRISTSLATVTPQSSAAAMTTFATTSAAVAASSSASNQANAVVGSPVQATREASASSTAGSISQSSSGMSGGAQAGLAIGIILAIALAGGLIFFCWRRKKAQTHEEITDEKHASFVDAGARKFEASGGARDSVMTEKVPASLRSTRTASTAPRLSLRPLTQFLPNLAENRKSSANALDVSDKPRSAWERQPANAGQNPFADAPVLSEKQASRPNSPPSNPFDEAEGKRSTESVPAAAAAAGKHSPKSSWEGTEPPTPKSTKFGTAAAVPVAAAGAAKDVSPPRGPNNVHRVQLDFKPSMDDELELRSGQLVRMLHEYDDGWALCIRMDRSQQGVAPRTCLSKTPVKPRPQGPPGPPGSRPGPPPQGARRSSNASPPHAPAMNGPMFPRPLTPNQSNQSSSPISSNGDASSAPAAVPARKPVPGQAM